jgi:hypothetical protein
MLWRGLTPVTADTRRRRRPMTEHTDQMPENNFCDLCDIRVAIYVEKKRRPGKLTRDQLCASCKNKFCTQTGLKPGDLKRINYKGM